jgi:hypothetical protein
MIAIMNTMLLPCVDLDFMLLYTDIGHDNPKQASIINSKICIYSSPFFVFFYYILDKKKSKIYNFYENDRLYLLRSFYGYTKIKIFLCYGTIRTYYARFGNIAYFSAFVNASNTIVGI